MKKLISKKIVKYSLCFVVGIIMLVSLVNNKALDANIGQIEQVFYISPEGSDKDPGDLRNPWKTFKHATKQVKAGDTVYVRAGRYKEAIAFKTSGNEERGYITFKSYPKETVIIDGEDSDKDYIVSFNDVSYYVIDGFQLTGLESNSNNRYLSGIKISGVSSNIIVQNNELYNIKNVAEGGNANGIIVYGDDKKPIENIVIENNFLHHLELGRSESLTLVGNVTQFEVINNTIEHVNNIGIDIAGFYGTCEDSCIDQARNGVVSGNRVSYANTGNNPSYEGSTNAAAIYIDGGDNIVVEQNEVSYSNFGFSISSEKKGGAATRVILRNNLIHHNDKAGLIIGGSNEKNGGSHENKILNNTFYLNGQEANYPEITMQNGVHQNLFLNNLFIVNNEGQFIGDRFTNNKGNAINNNLYVALHASKAKWELQDKTYTSFQSYQTSTKQDKNSSFVTTTSFNFQDYVNGKTTLPVYQKGGMSNSPDIGKYDFASNVRVTDKKIDIGAIATKKPNNSTEINDSPFKMDGYITEWFKINDLATGHHFINNLKAIRINNDLYVMLNGKKLTKKGQLYLNIVTKKATTKYFDTPYWSVGRANYLVEQGKIYEYVGDGKSWDWKERKNINSPGMSFTNRQTATEYSIPLDKLLEGDSKDAIIKLGYVWNGSLLHRLPVSNDLVAVVDDSVNLRIYEQSEMKMDGLLNDWSVYDEVQVNNDFDIRVYMKQRDNDLFIALQGIKKYKKVQIYFDTDASAKTGLLSSLWDNNGADYLIENDILYKHVDPNGKWKFDHIVSFTSGLYGKSGDVAEYKLKLDVFSKPSSTKLLFGFLLDDKDYVSQGDMFKQINLYPASQK